MIKIGSERDQLRQGEPLPWSVFDDKGRSLLRKGMLIDTQERLGLLMEQSVFRSDENEKHSQTAHGQTQMPFFVIGEWMGRLNTMLNAISSKSQDFKVTQLDNLCVAIQAMCAEDADAALAAVHLDRDGKYAVRHLIHTAFLVELVTSRMGKTPEDRQRIIAASLTANIGMLDLQERLVKQEGITSSQHQDVKRHPEDGVSLLREAGVQDSLWLNIVLQHHERANGEGYPRGLRGDAILEGARIIAIADIYHAKISDRMHRSGMPPTAALRQMLVMDGQKVDSVLSELFIKELGVYPPGAFVQLNNGDIAVVTHRGQDGVAPRVASIITPRGVTYPRPLPRGPADHEWAIKEIVLRDESVLLTDILPLWGYD